MTSSEQFVEKHCGVQQNDTIVEDLIRIWVYYKVEVCCKVYEGLETGIFRVDGVPYEWAPINWKELETHQVRRSSEINININRNRMSHIAVEENVYAQARRLRRQAWTGTWAGEDSFMDDCMRDHLANLYSLQKPFWLQFDDEMSQPLCKLNSPFADSLGFESGGITVDIYKAYFTPTYPIKPLGYSPINTGVTYDEQVFVNGTPIADSQFTVDEEIGMVLFNIPLTVNDIVTMRYRWRCHVHIAPPCVLQPLILANHVYSSGIIFEQITPVTTLDPHHLEVPCTEHDDGHTLQIPKTVGEPTIPWITGGVADPNPTPDPLPAPTIPEGALISP